MSLLSKIINHENRELKKFRKIANQIEILEPEYAKFSDKKLQGKTLELQKAIASGKKVDEILVEAFATAREAAFRVIGEKPYYVQLLGGIAIHFGNIAEMKTGEGKTLTSVLPAYLNALTGEGVHIITVNEYLATRDAEWMGNIFRFLGLTVGVNLKEMNDQEKRNQYACDIMYSTNNEIGFDYLRDNMVVHKNERVGRGLNFAIVDEVDSVLIDEARTPLIISGGQMSSADLYKKADVFVKKLQENNDYTIDEQTKSISLTESGINKTEKAFNLVNLYDLENTALVHHLSQALRANFIFKLDVDYVVTPDEGIVIVDKFTGRLMKGRAFSEGLHQAIEAKEGVTIQAETKTLATITFQNLFRMYNKLSGMTGTAKTEEEEFRDIYNMYVISIPTNKPIIRQDYGDLIFATESGKYRAIVNEIAERNQKGQPVLVGTVSIESSELISSMLHKKNIKHEVLNAKNHAREAEIIKNAGRKNSVTIATNMAGRGTDIKIDDEVRAMGGLVVIGTERHESRRIDNQLRGRSGRQGDPGFTQFCISIEDELMVRFGSEKVQSLLKSVGFDEDQSIRNSFFSKSVESAQKRVEGNNFDMRKNLLQYDDVMGQQRETIYAKRNRILNEDSVRDLVIETIDNYIYALVMDHLGDNKEITEISAKELLENIDNNLVKTNFLVDDIISDEPNHLVKKITNFIVKFYENKTKKLPPEVTAEFEKAILLRVIDTLWMEHINTMEQLEEGIQLRSYAQENPLQAYMIEGYQLFDKMLDQIDHDVTMYLLNAEIKQNIERKQVEKPIATNHSEESIQRQPKKTTKVGRNEPCPCGSGLKYKNCCGR